MSLHVAGCGAVKQCGGKMRAVWWRREEAGRGADGKETNGVPLSEVVMCCGKSMSE